MNVVDGEEYLDDHEVEEKEYENNNSNDNKLMFICITELTER